ncbi:helix-turn-helix domain-containing protein [Streptomyces sp. R-74717]|uniref:helix-turn-helix domain-containing protein n=1 Tax=Streptomyces sp. R-74717 TaxID=2969820 RepID=UPI0039B5F064
MVNRPSGRPVREGALTVAELVQQGRLAGVRMSGASGRDTEVRSVRIVDRTTALDTLEPHTAVVLTGRVAAAGWTVEMALRKAWEHAAACVVVTESAGRPGSVGALADRLGVPLLVIDEDALDAAVRIASAVARPDAGRTALVAQAARALADAGPHAGRVLSALHAVLPSAAVALTGPTGEVLAGRRAALSAEGGALTVRVEVPDCGGGSLGALLARSGSRVAGWGETVRDVLRLAVAPLTAWCAVRRLDDERTGHRAELLLHRLLEADAGATGDDGPGAGPGEDERAEAAALGWPARGPLVAYALRPVAGRAGPDPGPALRAVWAAAGPGGPLVAYQGCWVAWQSVTPADGADPLDDAGRHLADALCALAAYVPVAGGVAGTAASLSALGPVLADACAAAGVAAAGDPGSVVRGDRMGAAQLLSAVPTDLLRGPAEVVLAPLIEADRDGTLLRTLAVVLDACAAAGVAAAGDPGSVVRGDRMGAAQLLSAVPTDLLRGPAEVVLAPLIEADRDGTLLRTLAVVLDAGASPTAAAEVLGVHRNTVAARLERIRALGFDPDDASQRLALHLACRVLLSGDGDGEH